MRKAVYIPSSTPRLVRSSPDPAMWTGCSDDNNDNGDDNDDDDHHLKPTCLRFPIFLDVPDV